MIVSLVVTGNFGPSKIVIGLLVVSTLAIRRNHGNALNMPMFFFVIFYSTLNLSVNFWDLVVNYLWRGISYKHDMDFVESFSYKVH